MKRALISDIHANLEALTVVLSDIRSQGIREIYCLGDIVGYGPNPCECLDEVIVKSKVTILGNHDQATLFDPDGFNPIALRAVYWTREQLETGPGAPTIAGASVWADRRSTSSATSASTASPSSTATEPENPDVSIARISTGADCSF